MTRMLNIYIMNNSDSIRVLQAFFCLIIIPIISIYISIYFLFFLFISFCFRVSNSQCSANMIVFLASRMLSDRRSLPCLLFYEMNIYL